MIFVAREALYTVMLARVFAAEGLPPEWGPAIARTETNFMPNAHNGSLGDGLRGGSWGLCQMSYLTALALGFDGAPQDLLDPERNARLAAALCRKNMQSFRVTDLSDVAALYNSGKRFAQAPASTRTVYVPRVLRFAAVYRARFAQTPTPL
jgi:soluble lytic murein transglycosylase-like protein